MACDGDELSANALGINLTPLLSRCNYDLSRVNHQIRHEHPCPYGRRTLATICPFHARTIYPEILFERLRPLMHSPGVADYL